VKVLILNNDFRVYWKGRLAYLRQFLYSKEIDFYAIELFGKGSPYTFDSYETHESWWTCLFPNNSSEELSKVQIKKALFTALAEIDPDVIITSSIVFYPGAMGIQWAKRNKRKFIIFEDIRHLQVKRNFVVQWVKNLITAQVDCLWFPSKEYYADYSYFHNKKIHFFYGFNCIDNRLFRYKETKQLDNKTIICVARLVPIKNIDRLLQAWQLIEQNKPGYKLRIIGNGPEYDHLNKLKSDLNLKAVEFLGAVDNNAIPEYLYRSDAFILSSLSESWGMVVNEAMAAGLPVLLSRNINAGMSLLKDGINGFSFDPLSVKDIADTIFKFIDLDAEAKKSMSLRSLEMIDSMTFEKMGDQLHEILITINKKGNKRPSLIASLVMNLWDGKYNKSVWNKLASLMLFTVQLCY
jgi:glycosyltransferase involved in cell wall biosynthesis